VCPIQRYPFHSMCCSVLLSLITASLLGSLLSLLRVHSLLSPKRCAVNSSLLPVLPNCAVVSQKFVIYDIESIGEMSIFRNTTLFSDIWEKCLQIKYGTLKHLFRINLLIRCFYHTFINFKL
jgi:hypothetical protein